jgi:hypothetical protein
MKRLGKRSTSARPVDDSDEKKHDGAAASSSASVKLAKGVIGDDKKRAEMHAVLLDMCGNDSRGMFHHLKVELGMQSPTTTPIELHFVEEPEQAALLHVVRGVDESIMAKGIRGLVFDKDGKKKKIKPVPTRAYNRAIALKWLSVALEHQWPAIYTAARQLLRASTVRGGHEQYEEFLLEHKEAVSQLTSTAMWEAITHRDRAVYSFGFFEIMCRIVWTNNIVAMSWLIDRFSKHNGGRRPFIHCFVKLDFSDAATHAAGHVLFLTALRSRHATAGMVQLLVENDCAKRLELSRQDARSISSVDKVAVAAKAGVLDGVNDWLQVTVYDYMDPVAFIEWHILQQIENRNPSAHQHVAQVLQHSRFEFARRILAHAAQRRGMSFLDEYTTTIYDALLSVPTRRLYVEHVVGEYKMRPARLKDGVAPLNYDEVVNDSPTAAQQRVALYHLLLDYDFPADRFSAVMLITLLSRANTRPALDLLLRVTPALSKDAVALLMRHLQQYKDEFPSAALDWLTKAIGVEEFMRLAVEHQLTFNMQVSAEQLCNSWKTLYAQ